MVMKADFIRKDVAESAYKAMQKAAIGLKLENDNLKKQVEDLKIQILIKEQMLREKTK